MSDKTSNKDEQLTMDRTDDTDDLDLGGEEKRIVWERWKNPYEPDEKDKKEKDEEDEFETEDSPTLVTTLGFLQLPNRAKLEKSLNLWVANANFSITAPIAEVIDKIPGVEIFDVFLRYKFRVGIGKLFITRNVLKKIEEEVFKIVSPKDKKEMHELYPNIFK